MYRKPQTRGILAPQDVNILYKFSSINDLGLSENLTAGALLKAAKDSVYFRLQTMTSTTPDIRKRLSSAFPLPFAQPTNFLY